MQNWNSRLAQALVANGLTRDFSVTTQTRHFFISEYRPGNKPHDWNEQRNRSWASTTPQGSPLCRCYQAQDKSLQALPSSQCWEQRWSAILHTRTTIASRPEKRSSFDMAVNKLQPIGQTAVRSILDFCIERFRRRGTTSFCRSSTDAMSRLAAPTCLVLSLEMSS